MDNNSCSATKECNGKKSLKCLLPVAAVFVVIFLFNWLFHGVIMMPQYEATASQWRPQAEMQHLCWVFLVTNLVMACVISCLYCCMAKGSPCCGKCPKTGAKFGLKIGLLLGIFQWSSYAWLPIPMQLAVYWLVGYIVLGVVIGVVLSFLSRLCKKNTECSTGKA